MLFKRLLYIPLVDALHSKTKYIAIDTWNEETEVFRSLQAYEDFIRNRVAKADRGNWHLYRIERVKK